MLPCNEILNIYSSASTNRNTHKKTRIGHWEMSQAHQSNCQANTYHIPPQILPQQKVYKTEL